MIASRLWPDRAMTSAWRFWRSGRSAPASSSAMHQHAVHGRADLVAHGGEERGFRGVGALRRILGLEEVGGALRDVLLQAVAVLGETRVALAHGGEQAVEGGRQHPDLVVAHDGRGPAVILVGPDPVHGAGKRGDRLGDRALQRVRHDEAEHQGEPRAECRGLDDGDQAREEVGGIGHEDEGADHGAVVHDRHPHLGRPARQELDDGHAAVEIEVAGEPDGEALVGQGAAVGPLDGGVDELGTPRDGAQGLGGRARIALLGRAGARRGEDLGGGGERVALGSSVAVDLQP